MPDLPDYSQSVSIDAASVTIPIAGSVTISSGSVSVSAVAGNVNVVTPVGTNLAVNINNTPAVTISGTPSVTISSGSVTIANASIAVINASGTKITSARPPKVLMSIADSPNPNTAQSPALDSDVQALVIQLAEPIAQYVHLKIAWHPVGQPTSWVPLELFQFTQQIYAVPILPSAFDGSGNTVNTLDVTLEGTAAGNQAVLIYEIYESAPLWLEVFPLPQLEPNQAPLGIFKTLASTVPQWLISPIANVGIALFENIILYATNVAAQDAITIGHNSVLPPNGGPYPGILEQLSPGGNAAGAAFTPYTLPYHGAKLPRGDGIYVVCNLSGAMNLGCRINYSLF